MGEMQESSEVVKSPREQFVDASKKLFKGLSATRDTYIDAEGKEKIKSVNKKFTIDENNLPGDDDLKEYFRAKINWIRTFSASAARGSKEGMEFDNLESKAMSALQTLEGTNNRWDHIVQEISSVTEMLDASAKNDDPENKSGVKHIYLNGAAYLRVLKVKLIERFADKFGQNRDLNSQGPSVVGRDNILFPIKEGVMFRSKTPWMPK